MIALWNILRSEESVQKLIVKVYYEDDVTTSFKWVGIKECEGFNNGLLFGLYKWESPPIP